ncbi:MAG: ATP phosphoribosyltransferase regulatory subunit [Lachnospiraceae bacterium]|nr:ATP phosphoribosyltransferase regulatory subunit [Lachnospiraceae bacterium]
MENKLLHTPEGVRDIYGEELQHKLKLQLKLLKVLHAHSYVDIQTPTFEFFDVFSSNIGTTPSNELYKFFDKDGNTLVLRPDFTPSIARCVAKYHIDEENPIRLCYCGNTFINTSDLQGRLKESTQIGAELINDDSADADAEIIMMIAESLRAVKLDDFQITIGNLEYFKGLCSEFGIEEKDELSLREMISNKNYFGAKAILDSLDVSKECKHNILSISDMFGSIDTVKAARHLVRNRRSLNALSRLQDIYNILDKAGLGDHISFDLSVLSKYHYYTGIVFSAYTYGLGEAIVKGGRYDKLLSEFGKDSPAIGFAIVIDSLLNLLYKREPKKIQ